jgi:hypothetical protein
MINLSHLFAKKLLVLCLLLSVSTLAWAEIKLTYQQRQAVERQSSTLRDVEKKVKDGFAPNEAKGLLIKLDNIIADLVNNKCPEDNTQVKTLKEAVAAARKTIGEAPVAETVKPEDKKPVEKAPEEKKVAEEKKEVKEEVKEEKKAIPPPAKTPPAEPEKKNSDVKLTYQTKQAVDRQTSNLIEIENILKDLVEKEAGMTYCTRKIEPGLGLNSKIEGIFKDLEKSGCPKEHKLVVDIYNRVEIAKTTIADLEKKLQPKWELYDKLTNIKNYPSYQDDLDQLKRLHDKYNNSTGSFSDPKRGKELVTTYTDDANYFNTLSKKYVAIINAKTFEGENLVTRMKNIMEKMNMFLDAKKAYGEKLPAEIDGGINKALVMGKQAVVDKKPMFFTGGVKQLMDEALKDVEMLEIIKGKEDAGAIKGREFYSKSKAELDAMAQTMEEEIIASTESPVELYSGSDKSTLKKMLGDKWKAKYPKEEVLAIVFSVENWKRDTSWAYNNSNEWKKYDNSYIPVRVICKTTETIASIYVAYINKDHMNGDEIKIGLETKSGGYVVEKMLIKNLKK